MSMRNRATWDDVKLTDFMPHKPVRLHQDSLNDEIIDMWEVFLGLNIN